MVIPLDFKSMYVLFIHKPQRIHITNSSSFNIDNIIADYRITNRQLSRPSCQSPCSRLKPVILFNIQTAIIVAAVAQFATSFCVILLCIIRSHCKLFCIWMFCKFSACIVTELLCTENTIYIYVQMDIVLRTRHNVVFASARTDRSPSRYTDMLLRWEPIAPLLSC